MLLMPNTSRGSMLVIFAVVILAPAKLEIFTPFLDTISWFVHTTNWSLKSASLITKW